MFSPDVFCQIGDGLATQMREAQDRGGLVIREDIVSNRARAEGLKTRPVVVLGSVTASTANSAFRLAPFSIRGDVHGMLAFGAGVLGRQEVLPWERCARDGGS